VKTELVDDAGLKATGASGVVHKGQGVQIIYGPRVTVIKSNFEDYLLTAPDEEEIVPEIKVKNAGSAADEKKNDGTQDHAADNQEPVDVQIIYSPFTGIAADLSTAPDEAFASRMMGDGAVVEPTDGTVTAPTDGEVNFVFPTKHAVGFSTEGGVSMLIHVGIDTVKLDGAGFEILAEAGTKVKKGDPIMKLDLEYLKSHAPSVVSPVLCMELKEGQKVRLLKEGTIAAGEKLLAVESYK
jgi:PTS system D-glucosamine-specific IIC component